MSGRRRRGLLTRTSAHRRENRQIFASEKVILQLVSSKCLPILLYGTEACGLKKRDINSLDFTVNRFLMKLGLFKTNNISVIQECVTYFNFKLSSSLIMSRCARFLAKYNASENYLCKLSANHGKFHASSLSHMWLRIVTV